jgi:hypothetical protein
MSSLTKTTSMENCVPSFSNKIANVIHNLGVLVKLAKLGMK